MNPNKLTTKAQEALQTAQTLAQEHGHQALELEHLLLALLDQREGAVPATLQKMDIQPEAIKKTVETVLAKRPRVSGGDLYMSRDLVKVLDNAEAQAKALADDPEHKKNVAQVEQSGVIVAMNRTIIRRLE